MVFEIIIIINSILLNTSKLTYYPNFFFFFLLVLKFWLSIIWCFFLCDYSFYVFIQKRDYWVFYYKSNNVLSNIGIWKKVWVISKLIIKTKTLVSKHHNQYTWICLIPFFFIFHILECIKLLIKTLENAKII